MNKKRKISPIENTVTSEKQFINFPLVEFIQSIDICNHIFSFIEPYWFICKLVCKQWHISFKDKKKSIGKLINLIIFPAELNFMRWLFVNDFFTIQDINKVYDTPNGREYLTQFTETLLTKK